MRGFANIGCKLAAVFLFAVLIGDFIVMECLKLIGKDVLSDVISVLCFFGISGLIAFVFGFLSGNSIAKRLQRITDAIDMLSTGNIDIEISDDSNDEAGMLSKSLKKMIDCLKIQFEFADAIAKGNFDIDAAIGVKADLLAQPFKKAAEEFGRLAGEFEKLTEISVDCDLSIRGEIDGFEGGFKSILENTNKILDSIADPIRFLQNYLIKMSRGEVMPKINAEDYKGDIGILVSNLLALKHTLDVMFDEFGALTDYAINGNLSHRADASKLQGKYFNVAHEINNTLDAIIKPVQESLTVLKEIAKGNLNARVTGDYKGDHAEIQKSLNFLGETLFGYIGEISDILRRMAGKDFTVKIEREYIGDFAELKNSINFIAEHLNNVMSEINTAACQVESGAEQVSETSQSLSQGASEQAGAVEEILATVAQIAEQTRQNAANANKANELSAKAKNDAQKCSEQMADMIFAMNAIKESSKNIGAVVKAIDDIAFQTNILALNAAVEAARAGEHGKGFSVVAEEVRNLAARSATAAKETTDMIDNSIGKIEEGYKIANETAKALEKIVIGVSDSVDIAGMIAKASGEQAEAVAQINNGIEQISRVTQTNTATAEESASASEQMAGQAQMLKGLIQEFRLKGGKTETPDISNCLTASESKNFRNISEKVINFDIEPRY